MAGPKVISMTSVPFGAQADYKGSIALKSCHSEFHHAPLMWLLITDRGCIKIQFGTSS